MKNKRPRAHPKRKRSVWIGDATRAIASSKATSRAHGPFMQTCSACGERFWSENKDEHLAHCHPPPVHTQPTATLNFQPPKSSIRPNQYRPTPKPQSQLEAEANLLALLRAKGKKICPFCGKKKKDLRVHMLAKHRGQPLQNLSLMAGG